MTTLNLKSLQPAGHRILIKVDVLEEKSNGGIILAHDNKDRQDMGQVTGTLVAVGPTAWDATVADKPWAVIGDKVMFARHAGFTVKIQGELFRVCNDEDVTAIVEV